MSVLNAGLPSQPDRSSQTVTKAIVNACSTDGYTPPAIDIGQPAFTKEVLSGDLTAGELKTFNLAQGPGMLPLLTVYSKDSTSRTIRVVLLVDGITVLDSTSASFSTSNRGCLVAGAATWSSTLAITLGPPIRWSRSLVLKIASSVSETNKVAFAYALN